MSIVFRCPECGHKIRAAGEFVGKQARCKCGATFDVPLVETAQQATDILDPAARAWALKPNPSDDGFEPISAWSPLFSGSKDKGPADYSASAHGRWRAILIGFAGLLGLILVVGLGTFVFNLVRRPGSPDVQIAQQNPADENPDPAEILKTVPVAPPPLPKKQAKVLDAPVIGPPPPPLLVRGLALADPPGPDSFQVKHPPMDSFLSVKDRHTIEVIHWYTAPSFVVEDSPDKTRLLSLNKEAAAKLGVLLIAVQVRLPAEPLIGKNFAVLNPDAKLIAVKGGPYYAIGIRVREDIWFAPPEGQRLYPIDNGFPTAGPVQQGWLFIAPLADLEGGRLSFQFHDQAPVPLRAESRRIIPKQGDPGR